MKRFSIALFLGIALLCMHVWGGVAQMQKCRILKTTGESLYWVKENAEWKKLDKDAHCKPGHTIKTKDDSELHLSFEPAITAFLSENSVLTLDKLLIDHEQKAIRMRLNFQNGTGKFTMPSELQYTLLFTLVTPSASLYIANADFSVTVDKSHSTRLEVYRGSVKVLHNISEKKAVVYEDNLAIIDPSSQEIAISLLAEKPQIKSRQKPVSVAMLSIYSRIVPRENLEPLSDYIAQEIQQKSNSNVFFLDEVRAMLRAEGIENLLNCSTDSCISKIGSYLGVDLVVIGNLGQLGNRYIFNLKIIDALRDRTKNRVSAVVDNDIGVVFNQVPALIDTLITGKLKPEHEVQAEEGDSVFIKRINKEMVWIFPGTFYMGSKPKEGEIDELPQHKVILNGFYIDKQEVTREEFEKVMGYNPSKFKGCPFCPVDNVSWFEAEEYCQKVKKRLPTEAEWEYACRAGSESVFSSGATLSSNQANFNGLFPYGGVPKGQFRKKPLPVGSFKPNAWNLYDMHGNVWEWCSDWYDVAYYGNSSEKNPKGPAEGSYKVVRGGAWDSDGTGLRITNRISYSPSVRLNTIGFRCVKDSFE
jgi:formylglycine-generating enzyme required for sulfatase activity